MKKMDFWIVFLSKESQLRPRSKVSTSTHSLLSSASLPTPSPSILLTLAFLSNSPTSLPPAHSSRTQTPTRPSVHQPTLPSSHSTCSFIYPFIQPANKRCLKDLVGGRRWKKYPQLKRGPFWTTGLVDAWEALPRPSALSPSSSCLVPTVWDHGADVGVCGPDSTPSSSFCVMLAVELTERSPDT